MTHEDTMEGLSFSPIDRARPRYVYVASSWRNPMHTAVCASLRASNIPHYDFKNPEGGTGFSWKEVKKHKPWSDPTSDPLGDVSAMVAAMGRRGGIAHSPVPKGSDWEPLADYFDMVRHPRAVEGFEADFAAMDKADTFVMVLPCGKSAHLELGWAIGVGLRTAILAEDPIEPELMYRMVDYISPNLFDLLGWLGVED